MLTFARLLSFPLTFKNLDPKINAIDISDITAIRYNDRIVIHSVANGHEVYIENLSDSIAAKNPVRVFCDCDFFKYNLAYPLYKTGSLLFPERFMLKPPKHKNTSMQLSGCKHIILMARAIWTNKNITVRLGE